MNTSKQPSVSLSEVIGDKSISSKKSSRSLSKSSISKKNKHVDVESEDISLSQLELMANKKKINKPAEQMSIISDKEFSDKKNQISKSSKRGSSSSISVSTEDTKYKRNKQKLVDRENTNDQIRKDKSEYLYKFNKLNIKGKWSSLRLDMTNTLDEIRNEYERVRNEIQTERSVGFFKRMLLLGVQGIEMMNTKFDPLGVDLDGWSEAMGYSMENQEYDEVMAELYEKYKGSGQMSPEVKLIFMIISSATMFTISKKITKLDSNNALKSLIGGLMGNNQSQQQPQQQYQQQPQQQQYQQQPQQYLQQYQQQYQQQQQQQPQQQYQQQMYIPNPSELRNSKNVSETTDDRFPSKMNAPDDIDINNILKTMNERQKEKDIRENTETTEDILKNITINQKKTRGRGRPPKKINI
jgi:hypothetical protein